MITEGIYSINEELYESANTRYIKNNRCVFGWKTIFNVTLYRRILGIDIIPGSHIELGKVDGNPIRIMIGRPDKITIDKNGLVIILDTL